MARKKAEVAITCNIRQPKQAQKILITALENLRKEYDRLVAAGKQNEAEAQKMKKDMDALTSAVDTNKQSMNRIKTVMDNLAGSTLKQLNAALREVKRQMSGKSSDSADLAKLQSQYNAITEQIKKLKGETLDITKGMRTLSSQTDAWLTKAIAKQKELMAQTRRNTQEYQAQKSVLKNLLAEQSRRTNLAIQTRGNAAMALAGNPAKASMVDLRAARQDLLAYRDNIGKGGINLGSTKQNESAIKQINDMLKAIDAQIDSINGKEQKVALSAQQIVQSVKQIDFNKATPTQLKAKLDEVNNALANMGKNDPMRTRLVQSANQLKAALSSINGEMVNVRGVLANLDKASPQKLKAALDQVNRSLEKLGQNSSARKKLQDDAQKLRNALDQINRKTVDVDKVLRNLNSASLKDLKAAASQLEVEIASLNRRTDAKAFAVKRNELKKLNSEIQRVSSSVSKQGSAWTKTFQAISAYMGITMIIGKVQQMLTSVIHLNLKFSDQLADIRKVSGLAMRDINDLAARLAGIDTRTSIEELNRIAYAGAKLGIGKYGVEGLESFTRAANQINVALKEDLGADALTSLSKITEVMGLINTMGVERSMLATGSAMFQLSATSTATAGNIVEFSKRLTGLAKVTGITTDQLLGLASASDAMFLMPEVSATAFNKLFTSIQTKHNLIEKELQIAPGTINDLFSAGKAMDAIILIFEKMKKKGNMNALQGVFKDLGSDGARLVNVMVTMSQNVDMLKDHLDTAKESFESATAVTNEYNIQQQTAAALMERAKNIWEKAFVNPDGVDNVKGLAKAWYDMSVSLTSSEYYMTALKGSINLVLIAVKALIAILPALLTFLMVKGAIAVFMGIASAVKSVYTATIGATGAMNAFNAAVKGNGLALLASLLAQAAFAFISFFSSSEKASESVDKLKDSLADGYTELRNQTSALRSYIALLDDVSLSEKQRERILRKVNRTYKPYLDNLGIEIKSVKDLKDHYADLNREMRKKIFLQMRDKSYTEILDTDTEDRLAPSRLVSNATMKYADVISRNPQFAAYDTAWLEEQYAAGTMPSVEKMVQSALNVKAELHKDAHGNFVSDTGKSYYTAELQDAIYSYFAARKLFDAEKKKIDDAYDPLIGELTANDIVDMEGLDNDAPDKDAIRDAKRDKQRQMNQWRSELKEEQQKVIAVMDNIRNFYQRQITQVLKRANEQGWDEALIRSVTDAIIARQNVAMSQARKSIAGVKNEWEQFKQTMNNDLLEQDDIIGYDDEGTPATYNESKLLLDLIQAADIDTLRQKISKLEINLEKPEGSALYEIWAGATANEKAVESAEQRRIRERNKLLLEDNYTQKVNSDYASSMSRLGFFDANPQQTATLLKGGEDAEKLLADINADIDSVFVNARSRYVELISIGDVSSEKGRNSLLEIIFGKDWSRDKTTLTEIVDATGSDLQLFYGELIKYCDDYTEATKKAEERTKKLADFLWNHSDIKAKLDTDEANNELYKKGLLHHLKPDEAIDLSEYGVYGNSRFVSDFGVDPEIEAYRLKMEAAKAYYDFLKAHGMEDEQLREQQKSVAEAQAAYVEKLTARIKKQMDDVLGMHEPIENFGTKAGEAFALMTEDAEAGRKALKAAVGDMINDFMKQTVEMTKEYIKRRLMQKIHDRLTSVEAAAHEAELTEIQTTGDTMRLGLHQTVETGLTNIDKTQAIVRETTAQEEVVSEVGTEAAGTGAKVSLGIAGGAAKTIGSLGWWGIPLVAVITMLLNGLLSFAMSKVSSLFGGGKAASDSGATAKLVSGMLTYDSGNVQAFRGVEDGKTYPVVGSDGKVYAAKDGGELSTGLVEDPITTLVNGQPALVAERGPEMVIGRETTAAMMMARPDILAEIVRFDRQRSGRTYRAYDSGNIDELQLPMPNGSNTEDMTQLRETINALTLVLSTLQRDGIAAYINQYGRGGVAQSARSGGKFMQRNSGDPLWRG